MSCYYPGSRTKQRISGEVNRGRNCEPDVSGCAKADGCDDVYKHDMVGTIPSWSFSVLFASHHGLVNLCRAWCDGCFYSIDFSGWQNGQQVTGIYFQSSSWHHFSRRSIRMSPHKQANIVTRKKQLSCTMFEIKGK